MQSNTIYSKLTPIFHAQPIQIFRHFQQSPPLWQGPIYQQWTQPAVCISPALFLKSCNSVAQCLQFFFGLFNCLSFLLQWLWVFFVFFLLPVTWQRFVLQAIVCALHILLSFVFYGMFGIVCQLLILYWWRLPYSKHLFYLPLVAFFKTWQCAKEFHIEHNGCCLMAQRPHILNCINMLYAAGTC